MARALAKSEFGRSRGEKISPLFPEEPQITRPLAKTNWSRRIRDGKAKTQAVWFGSDRQEENTPETRRSTET
jgi:hypothetical protein